MNKTDGWSFYSLLKHRSEYADIDTAVEIDL
jgi:hypothetical protein